jgi:putative transposase
VIDAEKANYPIAWMCALLGVPRSSFYAWRNRAESATAARRRVLAAHVQRVFGGGRGAYGCRRVAAQLNRDGHPCSVGLVADLMRELGLRACQPRAYKRTTVPGEEPVASPDLIGRDFTATAPGTRLVGDITYLKTGEGWLYLATVIDLATRMVTGWQLASHMRTSLVTDALAMAITHGHAAPGAIFHSDRGAQGGFNRWSQHLLDGGVVYDDAGAAAAGSVVSGADSLSWTADSGLARGSGAFLGGDCPRCPVGGRRARGGRVACGRNSLVSPRWRRGSETSPRGVRPLPVVRGAGGYRYPARAEGRCPRDRPAAGPFPLDDLT